MFTTEDISDTLYRRLMLLPRANLIELMMEALDYMEAYNGRTRQQCLMLALEAKEIEGGWKLPSLKDMKEVTR